MAQNITSNASATVSNKSLEKIFHSAGISSLFQEQFPHVHELMNYDFEGTTSILCLQGVFQLYRFDKVMKVEHEGNDNIKAWTDYLAAIIEYLKSVNDDCRLEDARKQLALHIHQVHYEKFPYWPCGAVNKIQQSKVILDTCGSYEYGPFLVGWSCVGIITVQDMRPQKDVYSTFFNGQPEFKVLYCNQKKLKEVEALATTDIEKMKTMVSQYKKPLTWDTFEAMLTNT